MNMTSAVNSPAPFADEKRSSYLDPPLEWFDRLCN